VVAIAMQVAISVGYEVFLANGEAEHQTVLQPFYYIGSLCQRYLFTSTPTEREIRVAITALEALKEASALK
jgi:uncharacterized protein YqhQ